MSNNIVYPRQIFKSARTLKTLGVDMHLSSNCLNPLELHDEFSRFTVTILEKSGDKYSSYTANINPREVPYIYELVRKNIGAAKTVTEASPAYTRHFNFGEFKGKTPATVLLAVGGYDKLKVQRQILAEGVSKYKANQDMIDAIDEAFKLLENGELKDDENVRDCERVIFDSDYRPKHKSADADGYLEIRRILITYDMSLNNPYKISIETLRAPVVVSPQGLNKIMLSQGKDHFSGSFNMTEKEFFQMIFRMNKTLELFEQMVFASAYDKAVDLDKKQREERV